MGFKSACGAFLSPLRWSAERRTTTPVPSSKEGDYGGRNEIFSNLWLARCKATDPWLWLAGLAVCRKREGVPLPRSGGGRSRSGRAFRCVGFLGRSPKPFLHPFVGTKGCPRRVGVQTMISKRLSPPEVIANYHLNIPPQVVRPAPVFTSAASRTRPPAARPAPG